MGGVSREVRMKSEGLLGFPYLMPGGCELFSSRACNVGVEMK
jgi:hypothetical protein